MGKIQLLGLARPLRKHSERTFTDPGQPGVELTLRLAPMDVVTASQAQSIADDLILEWVTPEGRGPNAFPMGGGGEPAMLSPQLCKAVASVCASQVGEDRYDPEELIAAAIAMPQAWGEICNWLTALSERRTPNPNPSAADGASSSDPPSGSTNGTRNPSCGEPASSGSSSNSSALSPASSAPP